MSSNWKNKILNHEVTPPGDVWDSIVQKLDAEEQDKTPDLATKMTEFEVTPPFAAWDAITAELDKEDEIKVIPIASKKNNSRPMYYRMAAAASVILVIASVIWYKNTKVTGTTEPPIAKTTVPANDKDTTAVTPSKNLVAVNDTPVLKPSITIPKNNTGKEQLAAIEPVHPTEYVKGTDVAPLTTNPFDNNKEKLVNGNGEYAVNTDVMNVPDRYVIVTGADGTSKRVSAKLSAYLGYLNNNSPENEEALDKIIREGPLWKSKLKDWSNKLINNDMSPSLSNFMDVIELSKLLSEK